MRVLVTGASEGIGGAICRKLAADHAKTKGGLTLVMTTSGSKGAPDGLAAELESQGARCLALTGDLTSPDICAEIAEKTLAFAGGLDVFISNAGSVAPAPLATVPLEKWDRQFALNVRPTLIFAQKFYEALKESRGSIVAVASMSGMQAHPGQAGYSPAKAALIMLCRNLAQEWARDGIRVNAVSPGMIHTPLTDGLYRNEDVKLARENLVPLGRIGRPQDIAEAVCFLAGPGAAYITGQTLLADGGLCDSMLGRVPGLPS